MRARSPTYRWYAHLLGTFTLRCGKRVAALPASADARALLAYLLLHREQPHPRAVLLGLFFPDLSEPRARRVLTQAIWHIRRVLPHLVCADAETLEISHDARVWIDVEEFKKIANCELRICSLQPPTSNL